MGKQHYNSGKDNGMYGRRGEKSPSWKGGRRPDIKGYVRIYCPSHPYANTNGYVLEHRLVMEKHIGRVLLPTEEIHHINGKPSDNRIENLMLFGSKKEHSKHHNPKGGKAKGGKKKNVDYGGNSPR